MLLQFTPRVARLHYRSVQGDLTPTCEVSISIFNCIVILLVGTQNGSLVLDAEGRGSKTRATSFRLSLSCFAHASVVKKNLESENLN